MVNSEISKIIHEKVVGECWHRIELRDDGNLVRAYCVKCETFGVDDNWVDYFSWADYGPMLEECMKKEWWDDMVHFTSERTPDWTYFLNPLYGSTAIAEFVLAHPKYFEGEEDGR